jgi:hypothetical protein
MPQFSVNPTRFDPYKQFKFRVKWDGRYVPGICQCSGLSRRTEVVTHREGGDPSAVHKSPGQTMYQPIVLVRGRTFRKDVLIELYNEAGQLVMAFKVYRCWPSEYVALGDLDANDTCVAYESMTLEHEGWERDTSVTEPEEPSIE